MGAAVRRKVLGAVAAGGALVLSAGPAMACGSGGARPYVRTGGVIGSGSYASLTVTGACSVAPDAVVDVVGSITVAGGAQLDAQSAPSTITVGRDVFAGPGSLVGLGCQAPADTGNSAHACTVEPAGHSTITVKGSITALKPTAFLLNGVTARGNVTFLGGGSDQIPWSVKNNTLGANLTVIGQTAEWVGVMFNHVAGNVTLSHITVNDRDPGAPGVYIVQNKIGRNLFCSSLKPGVSGGFVPGAVNTVGGRATGQCAALV